MSPRSLARSAAALLGALSLTAATVPTGEAATSAPSERPDAPEDVVDLHEVAPTVLYDIRYSTKHNFMGTRVDGYPQSLCLLSGEAATRLAKVQQDVLEQGYSLKVYDCYRPQRAVDHFVQWAGDEDDQTMKREFYPRVDKSTLFEDGYIAEQSGHSRASTVDLTLVELPAERQRRWTPADGLQPCYGPRSQRFEDTSIDMGTGYDCFDTRSHTADPRSTPEQRANRQRLVDAMAACGFSNYENEWWHFTLEDEPYPDTYFDFVVSRASLAR